MNNFPAMTEEQRQQLIESCQLEIKQNPHSPHAQMAKIALATLTAEPVAYTDDEELEDLSKHTFANMFTPRKEYKTDPLWLPLYTAPPAPVLRVADGWIKCSERYPEVGQEVLIRIPVCEKFNIENGKYEGDGRFLGAWFDTRGKGRPYKVTHWMPLPPPPEASNEKLRAD